MTGILWAALGVLGGLGMTAIGDMVSEEVRDRLDHLPHAILRLAGRRLDPALRVTVYEDQWLPDLTYILKGDEARPVTRLIKGTWFAVGILASARRITRYLHRAASGQPQSIRAELERRLFLRAAATTEKVAAYREEMTFFNLAVHSPERDRRRPIAAIERRLLDTAIMALSARLESIMDSLERLGRGRPSPPA